VTAVEVRLDYTPTARQAVAHEAFADELLYGGAAGGGKTDYLIGEVLATLLTFDRSNGGIFRRTFADLARPGGIIERLLLRVPPELGTYSMTEHKWRFRNGSVLELAHLQRDADVLKYQGAEYLVVAFDQLEQFSEFQYLYLRSRLRVSGDVADRVKAAGWRPRSIATANPGGPGHGWVKSRFIDAPVPRGKVWRPAATLEEPKPGTRVFLPAKVVDNPHLDESYIDRLRALPEDDRRALLDGDWDVYAGQRFRLRRDVHVVDPEDFDVPLVMPRGMGVDYGLDAPFAALWGALFADDLIVVYRELYAPGLTPGEQAAAILAVEAEGEREHGRPGARVFIDPSTFARDPGSPRAVAAAADLPPPGSIAWHYRTAGLPVRRANNNRLAGVAAVASALRIRRDGRPRLLIYSSCVNLIRTLPTLTRDPRNPEDVDTRGEDHAYDALRYLLLGMLGPRRPPDPGGPRSPRNAPKTVTGGLHKQGF
jgi:hypothetical protein